MLFRSRVAPWLVRRCRGADAASGRPAREQGARRAAETLREDLDSRGPVRVSEVESEQKEMLKIVRRLVDEGQIVLASGGADDFL